MIVTNIMIVNHVYCKNDAINDVTEEIIIPSQETQHQVVNCGIVEDIEKEPYTQVELDLLSRLIYAEAGSNWITDEHQLAVGSVVLNRINDDRFPDDLYSVIYQDVPSIQYACTVNGMIYNEPDERTINNAKQLLTYGSAIPENIVWQSQVPQGNGIWKEIQGHYFCY